MIAHVDMDCFFCACEVKKNPELAGKPVIVGSTGERGVVSAANYEARAFGVFSATPISTARKLCPDGVFLPVDFSCYRNESKNIMDVLSSFADDMQQVSVDEAYLEVSTGCKQFGTANLAKRIQDAVLQETGLMCSIGIAESRIVAKIASDFKKPAGITIVDDAKEFLAPLLIEKIPGIGKVTKRHYNAKGIMTIGDLANKNPGTLDKHALYFYKIAMGLDRSVIVHRGEAKSMSRERTFLKDEDDRAVLIDTLEKLSSRVYKDLGNRSFKTVSVKIRYEDFSTFTRDRSVIPDNRLSAIIESTKGLFDENYSGSKVRLLGVRLLLVGEVQMRLDAYLKP